MPSNTHASGFVGAVYQYETLRPGEIRLLRLSPGSDHAPLTGTLATFTHKTAADDDHTPADSTPSPDPTPPFPPPQPPYQALSYYWGPDRATSAIYFPHAKSTGTQTALPIKPNLAAALMKLRREIEADCYMDIWTDAICIDQNNIPERNAQIQRMADIYSEATKVHIWLGERSEDSDLAMNFAKEIKDPMEFEQALKEDEAKAAEWLALSRLMHRSWFSRRWVVQEISLAKTAVVHCGNQSISWDDLEEAISIFSTMESNVRKNVRSSKKHGNPIDFLGEVKGMGATHLVEIASNIVQRTPIDRDVMEHRMSLEGLMSTMTMFETSNPYDVVYALLWLAHDVRPNAALSNLNVQTPLGTPSGSVVASFNNSPVDANSGSKTFLNVNQPAGGRKRPRSPSAALRAEIVLQESPAELLEVNYSKTLFECYKTFLRHVFLRSKRLDIICSAWALEPHKTRPEGASSTWVPEEPLPSWIQLLSDRRTFDTNHRNFIYERVRADPLVGRPGTGPPPYSACGKQRHEGPYTDLQDSDRTLVVRGFDLGTIQEREDTANEGYIPANWLTTVGWTSQPQKHPVGLGGGRPEWLWRFLVAERGIDGYSPPPKRYRSACTWLLDNRVARKGIDSRRTQLTNCPELVVEYLDRVSAVVWGRRLVIISYDRNSNDRLYGLAPEEAKVGDRVCILYGCSVPVVLRKAKAPLQTPRTASTSTRTLVPQIAVGEHRDSEEPALDPKRMRLDPSMASYAPNGDPKNIPARAATVLDLSGESYSFVGECYVFGMMAGEAFKRRDDNDVPKQYYTLV